MEAFFDSLAWGWVLTKSPLHPIDLYGINPFSFALRFFVPCLYLRNTRRIWPLNLQQFAMQHLPSGKQLLQSWSIWKFYFYLISGVDNSGIVLSSIHNVGRQNKVVLGTCLWMQQPLPRPTKIFGSHGLAIGPHGVPTEREGVNFALFCENLLGVGRQSHRRSRLECFSVRTIEPFKQSADNATFRRPCYLSWVERLNLSPVIESKLSRRERTERGRPENCTDQSDKGRWRKQLTDCLRHQEFRPIE